MVQVDSLSAWASKSWNPRAEIEYFKWLAHERSSEEARQLHSLGNLVVPRQASLAASVMGHFAGLL